MRYLTSGALQENPPVQNQGRRSARPVVKLFRHQWPNYLLGKATVLYSRFRSASSARLTTRRRLSRRLAAGGASGARGGNRAGVSCSDSCMRAVQSGN
ncbi:hypothetical protein EYF80_002996 [Liparis tanakae]|uniref:Uncharacterized protein n=1 Tax=Liparis tanakae TaxID=230148 RepID=A0A4Z2JAP3_9TELE|nr:hypothetical protein EYF80_002996 [Liparis tanakae]